MDYRYKFSVRLAALRKQRGLSMSALGGVLHVSDEAVRLLERGKRSPSFEILIALADHFNVSLDYLCGRSDDPQLH